MNADKIIEGIRKTWRMIAIDTLQAYGAEMPADEVQDITSDYLETYAPEVADAFFALAYEDQQDLLKAALPHSQSL